MKVAIVTLFAASLLAACAADGPRTEPATVAGASSASGGTCFRMSQLRGHKRIDAQSMYVEAGDGSIYRWDMSGSCLAGAWSSDPLVMSPTGGSDVICKPIDLDLKVKSGSFLSPCIIKSFTKLTPAEVAAIPPKLKP